MQFGNQVQHQGRNTQKFLAKTEINHNRHKLISQILLEPQTCTNFEISDKSSIIRLPQSATMMKHKSQLPLQIPDSNQIDSDIKPFSLSPRIPFFKQRQLSQQKYQSANTQERMLAPEQEGFQLQLKILPSDKKFTKSQASFKSMQSMNSFKYSTNSKLVLKQQTSSDVPSIKITTCEDQSSQQGSSTQYQQPKPQLSVGSSNSQRKKASPLKISSIKTQRKIYLQDFKSSKQPKVQLLKVSTCQSTTNEQSYPASPAQIPQNNLQAPQSKNTEESKDIQGVSTRRKDRVLRKGKSESQMEYKIKQDSPEVKSSPLQKQMTKTIRMDRQQSCNDVELIGLSHGRKKTFSMTKCQAKHSVDNVLYGFHRAQTYLRSRSTGRHKQIQVRRMKRLINDLYQRDHTEASQLSVSIHTLDSDLDSDKDPRGHALLQKDLAFEDWNDFHQDQAIFEIVYTNDSTKLASFLSQIHSKVLLSRIINARDQHKRTPLFYAVYHNNYEMIHLLLQNGAETMFSDERDRTIIHYACIVGVSKPVLQLLLDYHEKLNIESSHLLEAEAEMSKRKININDFPMRQRPMKLNIQTQNIKTESSDDSAGKPLLEPSWTLKLNQPLTSLLRGGKTLDTNKIRKLAQDDNFKAGGKIVNIDEVSDSYSNSQASSMCQAIGNHIQNQLANLGANIGNSLFKQGSSIQATEQQKKVELEKKIKRTKQYKNATKILINLSDSKGKTALHYAAFKGYVHLVKLLIKNNALTFVRDYRQRKPIDLTEKEEITTSLSNAEQIFEERFAELKKLRKSLILDDYDSISHTGQTPDIQEAQRKHQEKLSRLQRQMTVIKEEAESPQKNNERINKKLQLGKNELSSLSDDILGKFCIGLYKDNALTHKMRFDDKENFQYLIKRGISMLETDKNGHNCVHHAVIMEKIDFLSYLLEGSYQSSIYGVCSQAVRDVKESFILERARQGIDLYNSKACPWIMEGLRALERSNLKDGNTTLHIAIDHGNRQLFNYLVVVFKIRDKMRELEPKIFGQAFKSFSEILEFRNKFECTPLLFASKRNQFKLFEMLIEEGANLYTQCNRLMNVLHYAILNENTPMIEQIVYADAEGSRLVNERNFRNETPKNLDDKGKYDHIIHHIWEAAAANNIDRIEWLIKNGKQSMNQKTLVGQNTPLHFAVINESLKAIEFLSRQPDILLTEKNALGQTPQDLAQLIPKKKISVKIIEYLHKRRERKMTMQMNKMLSNQSPGKTSSNNDYDLSSKQRINGSQNSQLSSQKTKLQSAHGSRPFKSQIYRQATKKLQEKVSFVQKGPGLNSQQSNLFKNSLQSEFSEEYDAFYFGGYEMEVQKKKVNNSEFESSAALLQQYDVFIEHQGEIGMFDTEIFKRWQLHIIKMNDQKKQELVDIFKKLDERKRGILKAETLIKNMELIVDESDFQKFQDLLTRYYSDTKITESQFIKMMINFYSQNMDYYQSKFTSVRLIHAIEQPPIKTDPELQAILEPRTEPNKNQICDGRESQSRNYAKIGKSTVDQKTSQYSEYQKQYNSLTQATEATSKPNQSKNTFNTISSSMVEERTPTQKRSGKDSMGQIIECLNKLIYVKGELMKEQFEIVIKRTTLAKIFVESGLLDKKDMNYLDIMLTKEFGNRPSIRERDLEQIVLVIAQNFYKSNFQESSKGTIEAMFEKHLGSYVEQLIQTYKSTLNQVLINWAPDQEVEPILQEKADSLGVILNFYSEKAFKLQSKNPAKLIFSKCLLPMMKSFEVCPFLIQEKDLFIIYKLLYKQDGEFKLKKFLLLLQNIAQYYMYDLFKANIQSLDQKIDILIKRIEISGGYSRFRKDLSVTKSKKAPDFFASTLKPMKTSQLRDSSHQNLQQAIFSARKSVSKGGTQDLLEPELDEETRQVMLSLFEYYASYGDPLNIEFMKTSRFIKLCKEINILNKENHLSVQELDLLIVRIVGNSSAKISFPQFLIILQALAYKLYYSREDPFKHFTDTKLIPKAEEVEKLMHKTAGFDQQSLNNKIQDLNNDASIHILSLFKHCLAPYFKMFSHKQLGKIMSYNGFSQFCSQFELFPDLVSISNLYMLYNNLVMDSEIKGDVGFDINLLVEALGLIALDAFQYHEVEYTKEQKLLLMAEKLALVQGKVDEKMRQTFKNNFELVIDNQHKNILNVFWRLFQEHFPHQMGSEKNQAKGKLTLRDVMCGNE